MSGKSIHEDEEIMDSVELREIKRSNTYASSISIESNNKLAAS
jgi:hypothetical protein